MLDCWLKIGFYNQLTELNLALWIDGSFSFHNSVTAKPQKIAIQNRNYPSWHRCFPKWNFCSSSLQAISMTKRNCRHGFLWLLLISIVAHFFLVSITDFTICSKGISLALFLQPRPWAVAHESLSSLTQSWHSQCLALGDWHLS